MVLDSFGKFQLCSCSNLLLNCPTGGVNCDSWRFFQFNL